MILDSPNPVLLEIIDEISLIFFHALHYPSCFVHNNRVDKEDIDKTHRV
jgi:hypothetical protein